MELWHFALIATAYVSAGAGMFIGVLAVESYMRYDYIANKSTHPLVLLCGLVLYMLAWPYAVYSKWEKV